ncbi:MAG: hypothetical protein JHC37_00385 [Campylobacteraceae bacterium]|jgi:hypothetical protein|nr:hypothetical protein [Campylobacteraceae bacterium]
MPSEVLLDARKLEAPFPLEYAIKIAKNLKSGEYMKMMHRMKPCKLEAVLDCMDIDHLYFELHKTHYVYGWLRDDEETKKEILKRVEDEHGRTIII